MKTHPSLGRGKSPVRTPEERNALIAPLLEPGSDWIQSFVSRRYPKVDEETRQELISAGYEALIYAADRWEERYSEGGRTKFFIYAQNTVRAALRDFSRNKDLPFHVPAHQHQKEDFSRPRSVGVEKLSTWDAHDEVQTPEEELIQKEQFELIASAIEEHLTSKEKYILGRILGFIGEKTSYRGLGKELGISGQRANQIYSRAMEKISKVLEDVE